MWTIKLSPRNMSQSGLWAYVFISYQLRKKPWTWSKLIFPNKTIHLMCSLKYFWYTMILNLIKAWSRFFAWSKFLESPQNSWFIRETLGHCTSEQIGLMNFECHKSTWFSQYASFMLDYEEGKTSTELAESVKSKKTKFETIEFINREVCIRKIQ